MIGYILLAYVGLHIEAPAWYWALVVIASVIKLIAMGVSLGKGE